MTKKTLLPVIGFILALLYLALSLHDYQYLLDRTVIAAVTRHFLILLIILTTLALQARWVVKITLLCLLAPTFYWNEQYAPLKSYALNTFVQSNASSYFAIINTVNQMNGVHSVTYNSTSQEFEFCPPRTSNQTLDTTSLEVLQNIFSELNLVQFVGEDQQYMFRHNSEEWRPYEYNGLLYLGESEERYGFRNFETSVHIKINDDWYYFAKSREIIAANGECQTPEEYHEALVDERVRAIAYLSHYLDMMMKLELEHSDMLAVEDSTENNLDSTLNNVWEIGSYMGDTMLQIAVANQIKQCIHHYMVLKRDRYSLWGELKRTDDFLVNQSLAADTLAQEKIEVNEAFIASQTRFSEMHHFTITLRNHIHIITYVGVDGWPK